jgi:NIPSNAP
MEGAVLDLRTYRVVPGGRAEFERIFVEGALPMLRRHGIDVVAHGPSVADDVHYFLVRAFASAAERDEQLASFYGSEEWRQSYDAAVMSLIEAYHTVVIPLTSEGSTFREALAG